MNEKRSFGRYALWFPVTVDASTGQVWAVCRDVSAAGILIAGSAGLNVGDVVSVVFRVKPSAAERRIAGRIVRVESRDDDPRSAWPHRMAIEFLEPDAALQGAFERASSRPPPP